MLTLENLSIRQGGFCLGADFELPSRGIIAIIGPSGAGKSTLLATISGFLEPDTGTVRWQGRTLNGLAPGQRPFAMLFQDNNLFPHMSAAQNVALALGARHRTPQARAQVQAALSDVGLDGLGDRKPGALSGGQQGRVALARMLLQARPVWLLDEPFSALGPALKSEMLSLVADSAKKAGALVLMVTHDPQDAQAVADHVVVVADGCAAAPVATKTLFASPPKALRAYLGI